MVLEEICQELLLEDHCNYNEIIKNLEERGIYVKSTTKEGVVEEVPEVYKNVDEVVKATDELGISNFVVRLRPIAVIKG
nr:RtcB family protein [Candidatus Nanopusillus massiliensis]